MPTIRKLTDAAVRRLKCPEGQDRIDYWEDRTGLGVRVSASGVRSWGTIVRALKHGKWTSKRVTLGRFPAVGVAEAHKLVKEAKVKAEQGGNPAEITKAKKTAMVDESRNTYSAVREEFLTKYRTRKKRRPSERTLTEWRRVLESDLFTDWEDRALAKITRRDVMDVTDVLMDRGHETAANRYLGYLRQMMRWAVDRDIIEADPTARVKKPGAEEPRDRVLTMEEIRTIWHATEPTQTHKGDLFGPIVKLLILTGQRRSEVAGMRWSEVTFDTWTLPADRSKNRLEHLIPLSAPAITILEERRQEQAAMGMQSPLIFTSTGKTSFCGWSRSKTRLDGRANVAAWALHDIRRSFVTHAAEDLRIAPHIIEALVNHVSGSKAGVAGVYNRAQYLDERRDALDAWADYMLRIVGEVETNNVVEIVQ